MKKAILILSVFTAVLMASCVNPCKHIQNKLNKHRECLNVDSVKVIDTFIVNGIKHDTLFKLSEQHDTIIIKKDNLTIKHYYDKLTDSVFVDGECKTDTLYRYRWKYRERVLAKPDKVTIWHKKPRCV